MLRGSTANGRQRAARTVEDIVTQLPKAQAMAVEAGCVPALLDMIRNGEETSEFSAGSATSALASICDLPQARQALQAADGVISILASALRRVPSHSRSKASAVLGAMAEVGPQLQAAVAEEEDVLQLMVGCLEEGDEQAVQAATALLRVMKGNGRNQERACEVTIIQICSRKLTRMGRQGDLKQNKQWCWTPLVEILGCIGQDLDKNTKKLAGVANAVFDVAAHVKLGWWSGAAAYEWLPGAWEAALMLAGFAGRSKANETSVRAALQRGENRQDFDWYKWLNDKVQAGQWQHATGVGAVIRGNDGQVWGKVVADEGNNWKLESGRIAKKATEGAKWYWDTGA
mmetsp:Transcript_58589/g.181964  ORF Transcript_58589/g.181964 Transcript_58589/m.181964 type:complete len:344 (-) Transcript_58589:87-1118(-)